MNVNAPATEQQQKSLHFFYIYNQNGREKGSESGKKQDMHECYAK